jgi:putative hydroxymethylpyrimidine transport system substrate-binding protein
MKPLSAIARLLASTAAAGLMMLALPGGARPAAAADLQKVRFVYDWVTADFELIPTAVAQAQGFYKDAGIDVSVLFPPDNSTTVRMLASGQGDIGYDPVTDEIFAAAQGIPVVSIAFYSQSNNCGLIGRPGEPIDMSALKGKKIAIFTDSWTKAMLPYSLKKAGVTDSEVQEIIATDDNIPMLLTGKVDLATNCSNYALADILPNSNKMPTMALGPAAGWPDIPVWNYTTTKSFAASHPDAIKAFLAATQKGMVWASTHQSEAVAELIKLYPSAGGAAYNAVGWKITVPLLKGATGYMTQSDGQWQQIAQALADTKQIPAVLPVATYYTDDFLK